MQKLTLGLVVLLIVGMGWMYYDSQQQLKQARLQSQQLEQQLVLLNKEVALLSEQVEKLDENSVEGIVREANNAILDGWQSLVNSVDNELKKARQKVKEQQDTGSNSSGAPAQPHSADDLPEDPSRI
ncbi:hypothetical protein [Pseudomaricurvus sp.]|uniref:hypothetical protein n=1 Tax=Pseudomaricurvus sp. TaxID=2004510 RepID=UPI003F6B930B